MLMFLVAYLGGVLTILSPCILPVLPFVFARAGKSFFRETIPMLAGMALTFAFVAILTVIGGAWVVAAHQYGRWLALVMALVIGMSLLLPSFAERLAAPFAAAGNALLGRISPDNKGTLSSLILGIATGLIWSPCAGPILGLVLTGAAINGANAKTVLLLLSYAGGAASSLALALLLGSRLFSLVKPGTSASNWIRRGIGATLILAVGAIAFNQSALLLASLTNQSTSNLEQAIVERLSPLTSGIGSSNEESAPPLGGAMMMQEKQSIPDEVAMKQSVPYQVGRAGPLDSLSRALQWFNSTPLTADDLRGKVVLIDMWTYSCINCIRSLPYVKTWAEKYSKSGLVVIGVHAPEFAFERDPKNVLQALRNLDITYPVALDNNFAIWRAFNNQYWPAHYLLDSKGRVRYQHFGEGNYDQTEQEIQALLKESGLVSTIGTSSSVSGTGVHLAPSSDSAARSPETYIGFVRAENFVGIMKPDESADYSIPAGLSLNDWALAGRWKVAAERAVLQRPGGRISFQFRARDLHLVLGPTADHPVRFRISIDGREPREERGIDVAADGTGIATEQRLYQLVRQGDVTTEHIFSIEFLDSDVAAYAFTFG